MGWEQILQWLTMIVVAGIGAMAQVESRKRKADRERSEHRAARRAEESLLAMNMMGAAVDLGLATAKAVRDGHANGTMGDAIKRAEIAQANYNNFCDRLAAQQIAKQ